MPNYPCRWTKIQICYTQMLNFVCYLPGNTSEEAGRQRQYTPNMRAETPSALMTDMINQSVTLFPSVYAQIVTGTSTQDPGSHSNQSNWCKIRSLFAFPDIA